MSAKQSPFDPRPMIPNDDMQPWPISGLPETHNNHHMCTSYSIYTYIHICIHIIIQTFLQEVANRGLNMSFVIDDYLGEAALQESALKNEKRP